MIRQVVFFKPKKTVKYVVDKFNDIPGQKSSHKVAK